MPDYFINGSLYIKLKPDYKTKIEKSPLLNNGQSYVVNKTTGETKSIAFEDLPEPILKDIEEAGLIRRIHTKIFNNNGFYQVFFDGKTYKMQNRDTHEVLEYTSYQEIQEKFISLYDFLKGSFFCGRAFASEDPTKPRYEVVATYRQLLLLRNIKTGEFTVMDNDSEKVKGYNIGEFYSSYSEKQEIYNNVIARTLKRKKGNEEQK